MHRVFAVECCPFEGIQVSSYFVPSQSLQREEDWFFEGRDRKRAAVKGWYYSPDPCGSYYFYRAIWGTVIFGLQQDSINILIILSRTRIWSHSKHSPRCESRRTTPESLALGWRSLKVVLRTTLLLLLKGEKMIERLEQQLKYFINQAVEFLLFTLNLSTWKYSNCSVRVVGAVY